jgi:hypothetical protein
MHTDKLIKRLVEQLEINDKIINSLLEYGMVPKFNSGNRASVVNLNKLDDYKRSKWLRKFVSQKSISKRSKYNDYVANTINNKNPSMDFETYKNSDGESFKTNAKATLLSGNPINPAGAYPNALLGGAIGVAGNKLATSKIGQEYLNYKREALKSNQKPMRIDNWAYIRKNTDYFKK